MNMLTTRSVLCTLVLVAAAIPSSGWGQEVLLQPPDPLDGYVAITILAQEETPPTIFRRLSGEPRNLILMDAGATTPKEISDAIITLLWLEETDPTGQNRSDNSAYRVTRVAGGPLLAGVPELGRFLRTAQRRTIQGYGSGTALEVWVKPLRSMQR